MLGNLDIHLQRRNPHTTQKLTQNVLMTPKHELPHSNS